MVDFDEVSTSIHIFGGIESKFEFFWIISRSSSLIQGLENCNFYINDHLHGIFPLIMNKILFIISKDLPFQGLFMSKWPYHWPWTSDLDLEIIIKKWTQSPQKPIYWYSTHQNQPTINWDMHIFGYLRWKLLWSWH